MNLIEFDEILCDIYFGEELKVYTNTYLEEVLDHLNDQVEVIQEEIRLRESRGNKKKGEYY